MKLVRAVATTMPFECHSAFHDELDMLWALMRARACSCASVWGVRQPRDCSAVAPL